MMRDKTEKPDRDVPANATTSKTRRTLLKTLSVGGGIGLANGKLPDHWEKPMLDAALLPAHGATTGCNVSCDFEINLNWNTSQNPGLDLDLEVITPFGTLVAPKGDGTLQGRCIEHTGDGMILSSPPPSRSASETIRNIVPGRVGAGRYQVFVRNNGSGFENFTLSITVCGRSPSASWNSAVSDGSRNRMGSISISPSGNVAFRRNV